MSILDKRCCDVVPESSNKSSVREFIHDLYPVVYRDDISDNVLNEMSDFQIMELVEELDWLGWK